MGCSTFAEYTVIAAISLAKASPLQPLTVLLYPFCYSP